MSNANVRTSRKIFTKVTTTGASRAVCDKAAPLCHGAKDHDRKTDANCKLVCGQCGEFWDDYEAKWSDVLKEGDICRHCGGKNCKGKPGPGKS